MSKPFDMYSWRRKFIYLAENDKQSPDYDPNKHKTLMRGAIDYDLEGDNIVAYLPFEEEAENAVRVVVPKAHLEQFLGDEIYDNEDLQAYDSDRIYDFFHNKWSGMFGKYDQMKDKMSESESMTEDAESVDEAYYEVLALIRQKARKLNDDDAYKFHELLKGFFNRLLQEDHTKDPSDKYIVKPCNMPGEPWAVWEGNKRIKGFETKEKAQAYADKAVKVVAAQYTDTIGNMQTDIGAKDNKIAQLELMLKKLKNGPSTFGSDENSSISTTENLPRFEKRQKEIDTPARAKKQKASSLYQAENKKRSSVEDDMSL